MKKRNLIGICVVCLLMVGSSLVFADSAQPLGGNGSRPGMGGQGGMDRGQPPALPDSTQIVKIVDEMAEALSLTDDQKSQISDLHFAHFAKAETLLGKAGGDRNGPRKAMEALRQDFDKDVKALLSDKQKSKFDELTKNRRGRSGRSGQRR